MEAEVALTRNTFTDREEGARAVQEEARADILKERCLDRCISEFINKLMINFETSLSDMA